MIVDHIRNREKYYYLGDDFKAALDFFATVSDAPFDKADIRVENSGVLVKARPMNTKQVEDCSFEAHKEYADIHFVAYGKEKIGYSDIQKLTFIEYDADKDAALLTGKGDLITLLPGYFMITLPDDAHMPCVCVDECAPLGKMIAKIKL
ncbi:MAG: YhcH/YjgK/YiaL family protein [Lachnospiraceae bacterium]|nr:YhcH/YjgK/YiaL family protein [Lachnospiraceae bacterium]